MSARTAACYDNSLAQIWKFGNLEIWKYKLEIEKRD
jgi:hypothetical protein